MGRQELRILVGQWGERQSGDLGQLLRISPEIGKECRVGRVKIKLTGCIY